MKKVLIPLSTILQLPTEIKFCAIFEQLQMETHFLNTFQWITNQKQSKNHWQIYLIFKFIWKKKSTLYLIPNV